MYARFITYLFSDGYISEGGDLLMETLTLEEAKRKAVTLRGCRGFCFRGPITKEPVEIIFKSKWDNAVGNHQWTSFKLEAPEVK